MKAAKIEEKPKEVKTEAVDEVQIRHVCRLFCFAVRFHGILLRTSQGPPKYTKSVLKKGDKTNFPKKGDTVSCWYTGSLEDGTVFDTNIPTGKEQTPTFYRRFLTLKIMDWLLKYHNCFPCSSKKEKASKASEFQSWHGESHPRSELIFGANFTRW